MTPRRTNVFTFEWRSVSLILFSACTLGEEYDPDLIMTRKLSDFNDRIFKSLNADEV